MLAANIATPGAVISGFSIESNPRGPREENVAIVSAGVFEIKVSTFESGPTETMSGAKDLSKSPSDWRIDPAGNVDPVVFIDIVPGWLLNIIAASAPRASALLILI
jgi:hypothetical protein